MSIANVTYVDSSRKSDGEQTGGLAWLPRMVCDFTGYATGDLQLHYTHEIYAGAAYWSDGSTPVGGGGKSMAPWRVRNALRSVKPEFLAVKAALEGAAAEEIGGVVVDDPPPPWLDAPMESPPEPEPEPEPDPES